MYGVNFLWVDNVLSLKVWCEVGIVYVKIVDNGCGLLLEVVKVVN